MSWYYAGPEAKPVGPLSVEELHDRRVSGTVGPDTFIIEHTGPGSANLAWKRYKDVFPTNLPPTPAIAAPPDTASVLPATPAVPAHPLFPSAPHPSYLRPTNGWCAWGFGLGLLGAFLSLACGVGLPFALLAFVLCIIGLVQVRKNPPQEGKGLAVAGLILAIIALFICLLYACLIALPMIKAHELTVTEQTSNDSE